MEVAAPVAYTLPLQLVIVEWGPLDGTAIPALGGTFDSGWFDTWKLQKEKIINRGPGGATVETTDPGFIAPGANRRAALYDLEIFCRHQNTNGAPLTLLLTEIPAPALLSGALSIFAPQRPIVIESAGFGGAIDISSYFSRTFRLRNRMVNLSFTYPGAGVAGAIGDFYLSAVLRCR